MSGPRSPMNEPRAPRVTPLVVLAFLAVVVGGVVDLVLDAPASWLTPHVLVELFLIALSLGLAIYLWRAWRRTSRTLDRTREELEQREEERDAWRERAGRLLRDLGEAMEDQFRAWDLTPAEREVALLLIKGYSHRQIARRTDRSERTCREHASSVYRKAGLAGRAELAAFFLEDVRLPEHRGGEPASSVAGPEDGS